MSKAIRSKVWHHKKFQDLQIDRWWNVGQIHFAKRSLFDLLQNDPIGLDRHRRLPLFHLKKQKVIYIGVTLKYNKCFLGKTAIGETMTFLHFNQKMNFESVKLSRFWED